MTTKSDFVLHRAADRGPTNLGWLNSMHTFSFGHYYNPEMMGFRSLRVINDDHVAAGMGFGTHPHHDMEIFSYVLNGALQHRDSMGNGATLKRGDLQLMSAGSGITHSEFNGLKDAETHFLQIWIEPHTDGLPPTYQERHVTDEEKRGRLVTMITPDGRDGSLTIRQDASVFASILGGGEEVSYEVAPGRHLWLHLAQGNLDVNGTRLTAGDAISTSDPMSLKLQGVEGAEPGEFLIFDLA